MYTLFISTFRELIEIALLRDGKMITKKEKEIKSIRNQMDKTAEKKGLYK